MTLTFEAARLLRDGAIGAVAALDAALHGVLPELSPKDYSELKRGIVRAMEVILDEAMNPAISAYPELAIDDASRVSTAQTRAVETSV